MDGALLNLVEPIEAEAETEVDGFPLSDLCIEAALEIEGEEEAVG